MSYITRSPCDITTRPAKVTRSLARESINEEKYFVFDFLKKYLGLNTVTRFPLEYPDLSDIKKKCENEFQGQFGEVLTLDFLRDCFVYLQEIYFELDGTRFSCLKQYIAFYCRKYPFDEADELATRIIPKLKILGFTDIPEDELIGLISAQMRFANQEAASYVQYQAVKFFMQINDCASNQDLPFKSLGELQVKVFRTHPSARITLQEIRAIVRRSMQTIVPKSDKYFTDDSLRLVPLITKNLKRCPSLNVDDFLSRLSVVHSIVYNTELEQRSQIEIVMHFIQHFPMLDRVLLSSTDGEIVEFIFQNPNLPMDQVIHALKRASVLSTQLWMRNKDLIYAFAKPSSDIRAVITAFGRKNEGDEYLSHESIIASVAAELQMPLDEVRKCYKLWWYQGPSCCDRGIISRRIEEASIATHATYYCFIEVYNQDREATPKEMFIRVKRLFKTMFPDIPLDTESLKLFVGLE